MNLELSFFIPGTPAPGGSKSAFVLTDKKTGQPLRSRKTGRIIVNVTDDAGKRNKEWRNMAAWYAKAFMKSAPPFEEPLKVEFIFYLRRPQDHYRSGKNAHMLKDGAPVYHTTKPDALKYGRSTEDALTGIVWKDDAQTVRICSEKRYMKPDDAEGCAVRLVILRSDPPPAPVTQP